MSYNVTDEIYVFQIGDVVLQKNGDIAILCRNSMIAGYFEAKSIYQKNDPTYMLRHDHIVSHANRLTAYWFTSKGK